jgi:hypothetical protein
VLARPHVSLMVRSGRLSVSSYIEGCSTSGSSSHDDWPSHVAHVLQLLPEQLVLDDVEEHEPEQEPPTDVQVRAVPSRSRSSAPIAERLSIRRVTAIVLEFLGADDERPCAREPLSRGEVVSERGESSGDVAREYGATFDVTTSVVSHTDPFTRALRGVTRPCSARRLWCGECTVRTAVDAVVEWTLERLTASAMASRRANSQRLATRRGTARTG